MLYDVTEITIENGTQMIQGKDFDILIMAEPVQKWTMYTVGGIQVILGQFPAFLAFPKICHSLSFV